MVNALILVALIFVFVQYDILLRLGRVLSREAPMAYSELVQRRAVEHIFSLLKSYRGFRLEVDDRIGASFPERFLLVANHQSLADIPVLWQMLPDKHLRFVAKKELGGGVPLVSLLLRMQGHALIKRRGDPTQAMRALTRFARRCKARGFCPVIFPEGTRTRTGELGTFHTGGLRRLLSVESLPIVVVALEGGFRIRSVKSVIQSLKGTRYRARIVAVLPAPQGKAEILDSIERSRSLIEAALAEMRA